MSSCVTLNSLKMWMYWEILFDNYGTVWRSDCMAQCNKFTYYINQTKSQEFNLKHYKCVNAILIFSGRTHSAQYIHQTVCLHSVVLPPWRTVVFFSITDASMRNTISSLWRSRKDKWSSNIPQVLNCLCVVVLMCSGISVFYRDVYFQLIIWIRLLLRGFRCYSSDTPCTYSTYYLLMFWCERHLCRWIVHPGESVPARRCEWWKLAYSSHPLLQQGEYI